MFKRISLALLTIVSSFMYPQGGGNGGPVNPPPPPGGGNGGGAGSTGPGAHASPIDMYLYVLIALAIVGLFFYARKYKTQLK